MLNKKVEYKFFLSEKKIVGRVPRKFLVCIMRKERIEEAMQLDK